MNVTSSGRIRLTTFVIATASLTLLVRAADAQPKPAAEPSPKTIPKAGSGKDAKPLPKTVKKIPTVKRTEDAKDAKQPDDPPFRILSKKEYEQFEQFKEWLKSQETPAFALNDISLQGEVKGDRALLTVTVKVQIKRDNEDVLVPLRMNNAILLEFPKHEPPESGGDVRKKTGGKDLDLGHRWWFKGKGIHKLTFPIVVAIRTRRIQLPLPSPRAAASHLKLRVPNSRISVKPPEGSSTKVTSTDTSSDIEINGLGTLLDLTWQPLPDQKPVKTELRAETLILVKLTTESIVLEAAQAIRAGQGSFKSFTVRLPESFKLIDVDGEQYQRHEIDGSAANRITVHLKETMTAQAQEPVRLKWTLQGDIPQANAGLVVKGFEVEDAQSQTGYVAISPVPGYRVSRRETPAAKIPQVNVSTLLENTDWRTLIGERRISRAYWFLQQPFQLALGLQEIEAYFTAEPYLFLKISADQAELEARFKFHVIRGAIRDIKLPWPSWKQEKWEIAATDSPDLVEAIDPDPDDPDAGLTVRLVEQITRAHEMGEMGKGEFEFTVKARRAINPGEKAFNISLPSVIASNPKPAILVVATAENVEADIVHPDNTPLPPLSVSTQKQINLPEAFRELQTAKFSQFDSSQMTFEATATVHAQQILAHTEVSAELENSRLVVKQRILYDVAYERLSHVRLIVPNTVKDPVTFAIKDESDAALPLLPTFTDLEVDASREARLTLKPRIGKFEILVSFAVDFPQELVPGTAISTVIPLIRSSEPTYSSSSFELTDPDPVKVSLTDPAWERQLTLMESIRWIADGAPASVPLKLDNSLKAASQNFSIVKAAIRTNATQLGPAQSTASYLIRGNVRTLVVSFRKNIQKTPPPDVRWDGVSLTPSQMTEISSSNGAFSFRLDVANVGNGNRRSATDDTHHLRIEFSSSTDSPFDWATPHDLSAPEFPQDVRIAQTLWEVVLPFDQYLFTNPRAFTPQFHWQRNGLFFNRVPHPEHADLSRWLFAGAGVAGGRPEKRPNGNAYQFGCFGPTASLAFQSMNQQLIVGMGAGLSLLVGFLLLKIPATRHVLTILIIGFAVAIVAIWYAEPVQLLLQPALLGLFLAAVAAFIENFFKRRRAATVVTLASPSDLIAPGSSVNRPASVIGSDQPTVHRQPSTPASEPGSASKSGNEA